MGMLTQDADIQSDLTIQQELERVFEPVREMEAKLRRMEADMAAMVERFHDFMYAMVYRNPVAKGEESKVLGILDGLNKYYLADLNRLPEDYRALLDRYSGVRVVCDYISGMTDKFAVDKFEEIYVPAAWKIR